MSVQPDVPPRVPRIGDMRLRCVLEAKTLTPDGGGGYAETWEPYALVWGALTPATASETFLAGCSESQISHRLTIRRRTDISATHRVRIGNRTFAIVAALDRGPGEFWIVLLVTENAPS